MARDRLRIMVCLGSEVLILLGVFFVVCMSLGVSKDLPPGPRAVTFGLLGLFFSFLTPAVLILTRVMMLKKSERKLEIQALCEHLRRIGLEATVESRQEEMSFRERVVWAFVMYMLVFVLLWGAFFGLLIIAVEVQWMLVAFIIFLFSFVVLIFFDPRSSNPNSILYLDKRSLFMGSVRVANRNIDLVELQRWRVSNGAGGYEHRYGCFFVAQTKVMGLEDKLKARSKVMTVRDEVEPAHRVEDIIWEGGELAEALNSDADLRDKLCHMKNGDEKDLDASYLTSFILGIKPDREPECVRIWATRGYFSPKSAFPRLEVFEAIDRIAQHIRSIVSAR